METGPILTAALSYSGSFGATSMKEVTLTLPLEESY